MQSICRHKLSKMDIKFWASFSVICLLVQCCQICEARPNASKCRGLLKDPRCPANSIGFTKRLLDEIMKRTDTNEAFGEDDEAWEAGLKTVDDPELNQQGMFDERAPATWELGAQEVDDDTRQATLLQQEEEEDLSRKELQLLLVRALLDDLENETFGDQ